MNTPWSKKHKSVFKNCPYSLSNSFAEPLSHAELVKLTLERGDDELVNLYNNHTLTYTPNGGSLDLREEVAKLYGPTISADHVLVTTGAQVALQTAALAFGGGDAHSIVFTPGYQSTVEFINNNNVTKIQRRASNEWQIDIQDVKRAIRPNKTKFIILNEPYNPAGTLMSRKTQEELVQLARLYGIVILCDEVYRLLEHSGDRLPAMCDAYEQGISCVTLSKPWGGCGITIGWLACPNKEMLEKLKDIQYFGTACPSRASEVQAIMTLRSSDIILKKNMLILKSNLQLLQEFMNRFHDLFEWIPPTAGAICFIRFKGPLASEEFGNLLQQRAGISIKPAYCFTDTVTPEIDYFRVGFGEAKMPLALEKLTEVVEEHEDEWREEMKQQEE